MEGKITGLGHIGLFISDMERTKKYYHDIFGFEPIFEYVTACGDKVAFLKMNEVVLEVVQAVNHDLNGADGRFNHLAMRVENIDAVRDDLLKKGVVFEEDAITTCPECFPNGARWILFRGPDNERLEITEPL